jgi:anti-sigma B factor antagonist
MKVERQQAGTAIVLLLAGRIDAQHAHLFHAELMAALDAAEKAVIVDMAGVEHITSTALASLLAALKRAKAEKKRIGISDLQPLVRDIFLVSRFALLLPLFETRAAALADLG